MLNPGTTITLREKDEDANLSMLELCNTTEQLMALVTAVSPDLVDLAAEPCDLIAKGWPVPSKVKPSNWTKAGLTSKQALALFARFKAINISENSRRNSKQLEICKTQLVPVISPPFSRYGESLEYPLRREVTLFRDSNQVVKPVWIEWKECSSYELDDPENATLPRIRELVALLSDRDKPREFRAPICAGYFRENDLLGLIFENSEPASVSVSVEPVSLYQLYDEVDRPDVPKCLALAHELSRCLLYLHAASWIHKGLSSYATVFFRKESGLVDLRSPFLSGFDYSRPAKNEKLTEKPPFHPKMEFYRHPSAVIASNYRREWDIYSLGIVLIEIAHWKPIHRILGFENPEAVTRSDVREKRKELLGELDHLSIKSFFKGRYAEITKACLTGGRAFGVEGADEKDPVVSERLQANFYSTVIKALEALAGDRQRPLGSARDMVRTRSFP